MLTSRSIISWGGSTDDFKQKAVTQMASGLFPDVIYFQNSQDLGLQGHHRTFG